MKKLVMLVLAIAMLTLPVMAMAVTNQLPAAVNGVINLDEDVVLDGRALFDTNQDIVVNLNGYKVSRSENWNVESNSGLFTVGAGTLTINGPGKVESNRNDKKNNIAVWAYNNGTVIINGGDFTNQNGKQFDGTQLLNGELIYASDNGKVIINGGDFKGLNAQFMLNLLDASAKTAKIIVNGGTFSAYKPGTRDEVPYNPAETKSEPTSSGVTSFVNPEANVTIKNGKVVVSMPKPAQEVVYWDAPETGDTENLMMWGALLAMAVVGLVATRKMSRE